MKELYLQQFSPGCGKSMRMHQDTPLYRVDLLQRMTAIMPTLRRAGLVLVAGLVFSLSFASIALAHPLGNFTINHFARLKVGAEQIAIHYVVDMAEISAFQALQAADANQDGSPSSEELNTYLDRVATEYADGILLTVDGVQSPLKVVGQTISLPPGVGGLSTLRVECDLASSAFNRDRKTGHRLQFDDRNHESRIGWHEIVVTPATGTTIFDSSAFGSAVTDELRAYPENLLTMPLSERVAELSFTNGNVPIHATALLTREGRPAMRVRDRFAELITAPQITPLVACLSLLGAMVLGGLHALSPGHGKTIVAAYLVGSKATARHAAFLGLTVTITHTVGVFALGLVTLFASQYVVPERLFPILSLVSGGIVLALGVSLFARRLRSMTAPAPHAAHPQGHDHQHPHTHTPLHHTHEHPHHTHHSHEHPHEHPHEHTHRLVHSHGGQLHSHLPPGADDSRVTWNSLLALGISGGLLPCPSALVVMLSAISLHRVGFGLLLVTAFSLGLAATLTGIGLAFVYAGRLIKRFKPPTGAHTLIRGLPVVSAFAIACAGAVICYGALSGATGMP